MENPSFSIVKIQFTSRPKDSSSFFKLESLPIRQDVGDCPFNLQINVGRGTLLIFAA